MDSTSSYKPRKFSKRCSLVFLTTHPPSRSNRDQSTIRIALLKDDIYLVHGAKHVAEVFRTSSLSVNLAYGIALKYCFGMAQKAADMYFSDTSGTRHKPIAGSNVQSRNRVSYLTHESLLKCLLGTDLAPASDRFERALTEALHPLSVNKEWVDFPDLSEFFNDFVGTAIIKALFGSALLSQNPDFVHDLWAYDKVVMSLAKRLPALWMPEAIKLRNKLLLSVRRWHELVRARSDEVETIQDEDIELAWGSKMIRDRYKILLGVENQTPDSVASTDLAFIWA